MTDFVKERAVYVNDEEGHYFWSDLSPFTQGYIEALFAGEDEAVLQGFSDLAPETLTRIITDCDSFNRVGKPEYQTRDYGQGFWNERQDGQWEHFPPLTVQLCDDGKVRFA